jgi:AmpE protein
MILIVLISALLIETFISQLSNWRRHEWIGVYARQWRSWIDKEGSLNEWLVAAFTLLPPILLAVLLLGDHRGFSGLIVEFLLSLLILLWCLGPQTLSQYFIEHEQDVEGEPAKRLLVFAHKAYFAPIFWFVILGPIATLVYRLVEWLAHTASYSDESAEMEPGSVEEPVQLQLVWRNLFFWLDWIPARVSGFLYLLTGDFVRGFSEFKKGVLDGTVDSEVLVAETAVSALALTEDDEPMAAARHLAERALLLLTVLVALISFFRL